jgi:hypothetical protein
LKKEDRINMIMKEIIGETIWLYMVKMWFSSY